MSGGAIRPDRVLALAPRRGGGARAYLRRNPQLGVGLALLGLLAAFALLGRFFVDPGQAAPVSAPPGLAPTAGYPLGTDAQGRDLLAVMVQGSFLTIRTGLIAGTIGMILGTAVGAVAGYFGGLIDRVLTFVTDVMLTIPSILFLVMVSALLQDGLTSTGMALIVAALAWRHPARQIRGQIAIMRDAGHVEMARLSGAGWLRILLFEIGPNLMPWLLSSFILTLSDALLASIGLEAMGLGPQNEPTLGMTIFWMMRFSAFLLGQWWWILPPVAILVLLFVSLYLINTGLDELSNPRLRRRT